MKLMCANLLSGSRHKGHAEIFEIAARLGVAPSFIKLNRALGDDTETISEIDALVKRFSIMLKSVLLHFLTS